LYRAVIFDIDGTLVDSNDAHARAWVRALADAGYSLPFTRVRPLIGKGGDKLLPELTGVDAESPEGKAIANQRKAIFRDEFLPHLRATRGAHTLVSHLRDQGLTLVVATSADKEEVSGLLKVAGVDGLMDDVTAADDAENSKPDPDVVHAAVAKAGVPRDQVVMIGDTPYDVEAAQRAGVKIVALRCGGWWSDIDLKHADAIYDAPGDLLTSRERWA
jgi:HAD superfamily hydrolase (TIGR01509 family)